MHEAARPLRATVLSVVTAVAPRGGLLAALSALFVGVQRGAGDLSTLGPTLTAAGWAWLVGVALAAISYGLTPPDDTDLSRSLRSALGDADALASHEAGPSATWMRVRMAAGLSLLFLCTQCSHALRGGHASDSMTGAPFIITVVGMVGIVVLLGGRRASFAPRVPIVRGRPFEAVALADLLTLTFRTAPLVGLAGVVIGLLCCVGPIDDPSWRELGVKIVFFTPFYAILFSVLARILSDAVRLASGDDPTSRAPERPAETFGGAVASIIILMFASWVVATEVSEFDSTSSPRGSTHVHEHPSGEHVDTATSGVPRPH